MQVIYTHIPEKNYFPREYSVAATLLFLFMVLISLVSVLNLLYFYISTFRIINIIIIIIIIIITFLFLLSSSRTPIKYFWTRERKKEKEERELRIRWFLVTGSESICFPRWTCKVTRNVYGTRIVNAYAFPSYQRTLTLRSHSLCLSVKSPSLSPPVLQPLQPTR